MHVTLVICTTYLLPKDFRFVPYRKKELVTSLPFVMNEVLFVVGKIKGLASLIII
jgi:hypothetical protein